MTTVAAVAMPVPDRMYPDEPAMAAVYVALPRNERTAEQWAAHLTAHLDRVDVEVGIEPTGERAVVLLTANDGSGPATLERTVDRLIDDPHSFGLGDAARTHRPSDQI